MQIDIYQLDIKFDIHLYNMIQQDNSNNYQNLMLHMSHYYKLLVQWHLDYKMNQQDKLYKMTDLLDFDNFLHCKQLLYPIYTNFHFDKLNKKMMKAKNKYHHHIRNN